MTRKTVSYDRLVKGLYEMESMPEDSSAKRAVPDFAFNVLNRTGMLYRPVVNEHYLETGGGKPGWPQGRPFAVCLTHDVDAVTTVSLKQSLRKARLKWTASVQKADRIKGILGFGFDLMQCGSNVGRRDPYHCLERWLRAEDEIGAKSTFFFWPGTRSVTKKHPSDCLYDLHDPVVFDGRKCSVGEMMAEADKRGWEIGLHPSWHSFNDAGEIRRQKEAIEKYLGHEIVSVRQHFLHYDIRVTPRVHVEAGLKHDSTLGFNDNIGFRFGTCYPWHLYDVEKETALPVMEIPLIVQDGAMLLQHKGMRMDSDTAFQYVVQLTEEVEAVGGVLTLNWHPHYIVLDSWWNLYRRTLQYLREKNPWFATVREVGEWFKKENRHILTAYSP